MNTLTRWFIHNPVAANLLMALILLVGGWRLVHMRIEGFPKLPPDTITITTLVPNAQAREVDTTITQPIGRALSGLDGVQKITASSVAGLSTVQVQKNPGYALQKLLDKVRLQLGSMSPLPTAAEKPHITENTLDWPAMYLLVAGETDTRSLQTLLRRLSDTLLAQPELSRIKTFGERKALLRIALSPLQLERYHLSSETVIDKIRQSSEFVDAGVIRSSTGDIQVEVGQHTTSIQALSAIEIVNNANTRLRLGDIAHITDDYDNEDVILRFNGQPAVGIEVLVGSRENLLNIATAVERVLSHFETQLPANIQVSTFASAAPYIEQRLQLLRSNAWQGLAIVLVILALFLQVKLAFWVAMGIPIALAGTLLVSGSSWVDYSLNDITTFGMILVLGILVDDAVVVGESVFNERQHSDNALQASERGVKRVAVATVFGVLTTVAAFYPLLLIDTQSGKVLGTFAGVVIIALLFSLLESKFILPAHLAHTNLATQETTNVWWRLPQRLWQGCQRLAQNGLSWARDHLYAPLLAQALHHRYAVLISFITVMVLGLGLVFQGYIKTVFFPQIPGQIIAVQLTMDKRTPASLTQAHLQTIERAAYALNQNYQHRYHLTEPPIRGVFSLANASESSELYAELSPAATRPQVDTFAIADAWRTAVGDLPGATALHFVAGEDMAEGFVLQVLSENEHQLQTASKELVNYLKTVTGVTQVRDELSGGVGTVRIRLTAEARNRGLDEQDLATQLHGRFAGAEVKRLHRQGREVRILLQNPIAERKDLSAVLQTRIQQPDGEWVPLAAVASVSESYTDNRIFRHNGQRVNTVRAVLQTESITSEALTAQAQKHFANWSSRYPQVTLRAGGEVVEATTMKRQLLGALGLAVVLIYILMAIPLKSYVQPLVIMSVVPFGFVGAVLGHYIMGMSLSLLSFFGMLALAGVVVNDSLVMMTHYNEARQKHSQLIALKSAGVGRFQAIFLTTATTVAGLTPLLLETDEQAQYLIPAAVSLVFGELFATAITLLLIPILLAIGDDWRAQ